MKTKNDPINKSFFCFVSILQKYKKILKNRIFTNFLFNKIYNQGSMNFN